jgi:4-alpha-glucanotransferase
MPNPRKSGVLLHPSSLPGRWSVGDLGDEAQHFLAWLEEAGQTLWQVLPLGPTGQGNSPYGALSSFAGSPLLISPARLYREGLLAQSDLPNVAQHARAHVDFDAAIREKNGLLHQAWTNFRRLGGDVRDAFDAFCSDPERHFWLDDWTLFRALKDRFHGRAWAGWDRALAIRDPAALAAARRELRDELEFHAFVQWVFHRQWSSVRRDAARRGITIVGDLPIYVAWDSADCWANRELFHLDDAGRPTVVAGVPPDYFSETGQLWGNPLYRWDRMKEDGYAWWLHRLRANLALADVIRLDHFRGFAAYWEVAATEETAVNGRWAPGPAAHFFDVVRQELGDLPLVAEDLGVITDEVTELLEATALPGMKILQFGFGAIDSSHAPHHHTPNSVVYTGTHDNDTSRGWFAAAHHDERNRALAYLGGTEDSIHWTMMRAAETSVARWAIIPAQDVFALGAEARMNVPGVAEGNWTWRARPGAFDEPSAKMLEWITVLGGRHPSQGRPEKNQGPAADA